MMLKHDPILYLYRDKYDSNSLQRKKNKIIEDTQGIDLQIWDSIPTDFHAKIFSIESLSHPDWDYDIETWTNDLSKDMKWSVALLCNIPVASIRILHFEYTADPIINYLATDPEHQGKGLATAVVINCISYLFNESKCDAIQAHQISGPVSAKILQQLGFDRNRVTSEILKSLRDYHNSLNS